MTTFTSPSSAIFNDTGRTGGAFGQFSAEARAFIAAIAAPGRIIGEVEQMRALQRQAAKADATDPARAAALRRQAARIGR